MFIGLIFACTMCPRTLFCQSTVCYHTHSRSEMMLSREGMDLRPMRRPRCLIWNVVDMSLPNGVVIWIQVASHEAERFAQGMSFLWVSSLLLQYLVWFTEAWLYIYPSISWVNIESSYVFALARHRYNMFMTLDLHVLWTGLWGKHLNVLIDTIFSVI